MDQKRTSRSLILSWKVTNLKSITVFQLWKWSEIRIKRCRQGSVLGYTLQSQIKINVYKKLSTSLISPAFKSPNLFSPTLTLTNRNVGKPAAAVIFLTCLFLPSVRIIETQLVGPCLSSRIFLVRGGNPGSVFSLKALHGSVWYFTSLIPISTPSVNFKIASSVIWPSTWA